MRQVTQKRKLIVAVSILAAVCMICSIFPSFKNQKVTAQAATSRDKYFTSIMIESGDTLWSIANENMTEEYASVQDYIDEVKTINNLHEDYITAGCYIVIPYYAETP